MHLAATRQADNGGIGTGRDRRTRAPVISTQRQRASRAHCRHHRLRPRRQAGNRRWLKGRTPRLTGVFSEMHDQAVSGSIPSVGARREQIQNHARYRRILLKLVGADRADLIGLYVDSLLLRFQPRVRQVDHQPIGVADRLDGRYQRPRRKNFNGLAILLLHDPEALNRGNLTRTKRRSGRLGVWLGGLGSKPRYSDHEHSHHKNAGAGAPS